MLDTIKTSQYPLNRVPQTHSNSILPTQRFQNGVDQESRENAPWTGERLKELLAPPVKIKLELVQSGFLERRFCGGCW